MSTIKIVVYVADETANKKEAMTVHDTWHAPSFTFDDLRSLMTVIDHHLASTPTEENDATPF